MAKVGGLNALFTRAGIINVFSELNEKISNTSLEALQYMGEQFVNNARARGNYRDRTGNLRSSIGYIILNDGNIIERNFEKAGKGNDGNTGRAKGEDVAADLAFLYPKGMILIGVAGMEYAYWVETRHHLDVITGSIPENDYLKSILDEIKF